MNLKATGPYFKGAWATAPYPEDCSATSFVMLLECYFWVTPSLAVPPFPLVITLSVFFLHSTCFEDEISLFFFIYLLSIFVLWKIQSMKESVV